MRDHEKRDVLRDQRDLRALEQQSGGGWGKTEGTRQELTIVAAA